MKPIKLVNSRTVVMPTKDIDTDQIMAARFLTTTTSEGLGKNLFYDLRFNDDGTENADFVLNSEASKGCEILVGGNNFGCGSSREHAPWGLLDYGFKAIISTEIADIFRNNSLKNGLLAIVVDEPTHEQLLATPGSEIAIDVEAATITLADGTVADFDIDGFARHCLLEGVDQLGFLRQHTEQISAFEEARNWQP